MWGLVPGMDGGFMAAENACVSAYVGKLLWSDTCVRTQLWIIRRIQIVKLGLACERDSLGLAIIFNGWFGKGNIAGIIQGKEFCGGKIITVAFLHTIRSMF
jgi:hypothetical protein